MTTIKVIAAIRFEAINEYREAMTKAKEFDISWVPSIDHMNQKLDESDKQFEVVVVDSSLGDVYDLIDDLRSKHPHLLIIQVDEEADFALPGRADEISTNPLEDDQLVKLIKRVYEDRRLATLRADALPPVRQFAKRIMKAERGPAKIQAAVDTIRELGFDYVAYYSFQNIDPPMISLATQAGDEKLKRVAPQKRDYDTSLVGKVAQDGETRIVSKDDDPNHPFVSRGQFGSGVAVAVGTTIRFGVLFACNRDPEINSQYVMMLELISAQLSSALAREARS
jgi:hypothetical protein